METQPVDLRKPVPVGASVGLLRASFLVSGMTFLSRITGFCRDWFMAQTLGAGAELDAFVTAFKIPNFFRRLFAEGAFSQAFVPTLSEYHPCSLEERRFLACLFGSLGFVLLLFCGFGMWWASEWIGIMAPGFYRDPVRGGLSAGLLRLMFPYLGLVSIAAFWGGVLNHHRWFAVSSFSPVLLNLGMIAAMILGSRMGLPVWGLAVGVLCGGLAQVLLACVFAARLNLLAWPTWGFSDSGVRKVLKLMVPALVGISVNQVNLLLDTIFASWLGQGSVSWLYYADRLMELPLGLFGVGIATVILPTLSRLRVMADWTRYEHTLRWGIQWILTLGCPAAILGSLWALPLTSTLFLHGQFSVEDASRSADALSAYAPGILPLMLIRVLLVAFHARQDLKTPVKVGVAMMLLHAVLNAILLGLLQWGHVGLATSTTLTAAIHAGVLGWILMHRRWLVLNELFRKGFVWLMGSALLFFALAWLVMQYGPDWLQLPPLSRIGYLGCWMLSAALLWALLLVRNRSALKSPPL